MPNVDCQTSPRGQPAQTSLPERFDGRRAVTDRAADPTGQTWRAQAVGSGARGAEQHLPCAVDGMPMDRPAQGSAAEWPWLVELRLVRPTNSIGKLKIMILLWLL